MEGRKLTAGPAAVAGLNAVDDIVHAAFPLPAYPDALVVAQREIGGVGLQPLAPAHDNARRGQRQGKVASAVQRQVHDAPVFYHGGEVGGLGLDELPARPLHFHLSGQQADRKGNIHPAR